MNKLRRTLVTTLALSPLLARAQQKQDPGYSTLPNVLPIENPAKIEVAEFFWYGCIYCYKLEPVVEAWLPKLPADAYFRRIPAVFGDPRYAHDAAIFYSFEALGIQKLHRTLFDAIHNDRLRTDNPAALNEWLVKNGVDAKRFETAMKSFGVQTKVTRAGQLTVGARIEGTPALMVQGRYTISTEQGGRAPEGMFANVDRLIPLVRKTLAAAK